MAGVCRDCPACTRSFLARLMLWVVLVPPLAAMARPFMRTCPVCPHVLSRHQRRADGSFRD